MPKITIHGPKAGVDIGDAASERKREHYSFDYSHIAARRVAKHNASEVRRVAKQRKKRARTAGKEEEEEAGDEEEDGDESEEEVSATTSVHGTFIPAVNKIILMPGLTRPHYQAIKPVANATREAKAEAEAAFWKSHIVVVGGLKAVADIEEMYKPLVKRLYLPLELLQGTKYSATAVTRMAGKLKAGLRELKSLEWLAVALVYEDAQARREELQEGGAKQATEIRTVMEAMSQLQLIDVIVLLQSEGTAADVGSVQASEKGKGEGMVGELLELEIGDGLAV